MFSSNRAQMIPKFKIGPLEKVLPRSCEDITGFGEAYTTDLSFRYPENLYLATFFQRRQSGNRIKTLEGG